MLIDMSVSAGVLIILTIMLEKAAGNYFSKRFIVTMWKIVLIRLIIPVNLPITIGIAKPFIGVVRGAKNILGGLFRSENKSGIYYAAGTSVMSKPQNLYSENNNINLVLTGWGLVAVVLIVFFAVSYYREYKKFKAALPLQEELERNIRQMKILPKHVKLYVSDMTATPITFGIIHPEIIFPKIFMRLKKSDGLSSGQDNEIKYVLMHESIHIKYADNIWKLAVIFAVCIHWFNPLVWLMYIFMNRDIEMACDERVILRCGEDFRKEYAMVLLNLAEKQCRLSFFANGFGKNAVKERIVAIMKFKKTTTIGALGAAVILAGAVTVFSQNGIAQAFTEANSNGEIKTEQVSAKKQSVADDETKKSGKVERTANNKAQVKSDEKDVSKTPEKNKDSKVVVEINDAEENGNATGNSASCTAYADGSVTYYVDGKQVDLTKDELDKLEKNGKVTINVNLKNAKQK